MNTNEKIASLRQYMKETNVQAYIIPSSDPHMSEYLPSRWQTRSYVSGFDGSAGTFVVTETESALWTDGRYFIQAERQISGSEITLMRMAMEGTPSIEEYLEKKLQVGDVIGFEGMVMPVSLVRSIEKTCSSKKITVKDVVFPDSLWLDRPAFPDSKAWILPATYAGQNCIDKTNTLRAELKKLHTQAMVVTKLDDIVWLLNVRGEDIDYNPYVLSYCLVLPQKLIWYVDKNKLDDTMHAYLTEQNIEVRPYDAILEDIHTIDEPLAFLLDDSATNYAIYNALQLNSQINLVEGEDPIQLMKAVKSEIEIENIIQAHIKDGIAMVRFQMDLEKAMDKGEPLKETDIAAMIYNRRKEQEKFIGESFSSIAAYGDNAAMMHYSPKEETAATLQKKGFLLLDCGGQYLDGTTDITRTYALGEPTTQEKEYYTLVLMAHINLAMASFLDGCSGGNIDILARDVFWKKGLDYKCGTGHGIGYVAGVHEGPQSLRATNNVPIKPGMILTDEPGIYEEGEVGIRIENELVCREKLNTKYGRFLGFDYITYCPIDTKAVDASQMTQEQVTWLNSYHETVYNTLAPKLSEDEKTWLLNKCKPLSK